MRIATFLLALSLAVVLALAQASPPAQPPVVSQTAVQLAQLGPDSPGSGGTVRMWRRAEIRVVPLDLVAADRAELESLRSRVAEAEVDSRRLEVSDPAVREQLSRQIQLMKGLLSYAERQDSDRGKSASALEVQRHLNQIEGQTMCEACHGTILAGVSGGGR
jgi:hypothetical protein